MKKNILKFGGGVFVLLIALFLSTDFSFIAQAKITDAELKTIKEATSVETCTTTLVPIYDKRLADFLKFLEQHFQNKSSNTDLANTAIAKFRDYKNDIETIFNILQIVGRDVAYKETVAALEAEGDGGGTMEEYSKVFNAYAICEDMKNTYISLAKDKMIEHIKNTSAEKRATVLSEKYKAINKKLRTLNFKISQTFGLFKSFKNKIPGFIRDCMQL